MRTQSRGKFPGAWQDGATAEVRGSLLSGFRCQVNIAPTYILALCFLITLSRERLGSKEAAIERVGAGARRRAQKHTHAHTHTRAYTQTHTHVYTHKHSYTYTQTHPILRTYVRTYMHTHMTLGQACTRPQEECGSSESVQECFEIHGATFKRTIENLIFTF